MTYSLAGKVVVGQLLNRMDFLFNRLPVREDDVGHGPRRKAGRLRCSGWDQSPSRRFHSHRRGLSVGQRVDGQLSQPQGGLWQVPGLQGHDQTLWTL